MTCGNVSCQSSHSGRRKARHTEVAPSLAICRLKLDDGSEEIEGLVVRFAALKQHADSVHGGGRVRISREGALVGVHGLVGDTQQLREASCQGGQRALFVRFEATGVKSNVPIWSQTASLIWATGCDGA